MTKSRLMAAGVPLACVAWSALAQTALVDGRPAAASNGGQLVLTSHCGTALSKAERLLNFGGTITNAGGTTITNISLVQLALGSNATVIPAVIPVLEPGQGTDFSGSFVVPPDLCELSYDIEASG